MTDELIEKSEAKEQVRQMGRMMANLYYHLGQEIIAAMGKDKAKEVVRRAVWNYGIERGLLQKERVISAGYEPIPENYSSVPDLPALGWDVKKVEPGENPTHVRISYCPFAEVWKEKGFHEFGRIYCMVDQAKYHGFHPESELVHLRNVLDEDCCCEMVCRKQIHKP